MYPTSTCSMSLRLSLVPRPDAGPAILDRQAPRRRGALESASKIICATKTAVYRLAMIPMPRVMAKPLIGPVPNRNRTRALIKCRQVRVEDGPPGPVEAAVDRAP